MGERESAREEKEEERERCIYNTGVCYLGVSQCTEGEFIRIPVTSAYLLPGNVREEHIFLLSPLHVHLELSVHIDIVPSGIGREELWWTPLYHNTVAGAINKLFLQLEVSWGSNGSAVGNVLILFCNVLEVGWPASDDALTRRLL